MAPEVVTVGETMLLLLPELGEPLAEAAALSCRVAGSETTVAIGLVRLGRSAGWISRLGNDAFGMQVLRRVRGEGVDTHLVQLLDDRPTGLLARGLGPGPINVFYYRHGSAASTLSPDDMNERYIASARLLFITGITPALSTSAREATFTAVEIAGAAGVPVAFDPNLRTKLWAPSDAKPVLRDLASRATLLLAAGDEAALLVGESDPAVAAKALLALGPRVVAVKRGAGGVYALSAEEEVDHTPAPVRVVDPVGAGDAFSAGFLAGWLEQRSLQTCVRWGSANGAACVNTRGDVEGLLYRTQLLSTGHGEDVLR